MADRPILFQGPMVRALLAGTKTQTRRVCKNKVYSNGFHFDGHDILCHNDYLPPSAMLMDVKRGKVEYTTSNLEGWDAECPYGQPGDCLWVREAWMPDPPIDDTWASTAWNGCGRVISEVPERFHHPRFCNYAADWLHGPITWRPSIHMPRWASRITLDVTGIRVERLQDISEADAIAEGVNVHSDHHGKPRTSIYSPVQAYRDLWESINGEGSWDANPWVWVVEFPRVTP